MIHIVASLPGRCNYNVPLEMSQMPGGEMHPTVEDPGSAYTQFDIYADTHEPKALFALALVVNAIRNLPSQLRPTIILHLGYVPYARQDRIGAKGEAHGSQVMAEFINTMAADRVYISDPHSDVITSLIRNVRVVDQLAMLDKFLLAPNSGRAYYETSIDPEEWILVAPDAGAVKKAEKIAKAGGFKGVVYAGKVRDIKTGKIQRTTIDRVVIDGEVVDPSMLVNEKLLVVDDICDGGRTFIELAKVLVPHGPATMELFVTHGIFSQGTDTLLQHYDRVHATNSFNMHKVTKFDELSDEELHDLKLIVYPHL